MYNFLRLFFVLMKLLSLSQFYDPNPQYKTFCFIWKTLENDPKSVVFALYKFITNGLALSHIQSWKRNHEM